jgi:hypothetical protein
MTPGDPCRACGPPSPKRRGLYLVPQPPARADALRESLGPKWRVVGATDDGNPRRDWCCLACVVWLGELLGIVEPGSHEGIRRLVA